MTRLTKRTFKHDVNSTDAELATTRHQGPTELALEDSRNDRDRRKSLRFDSVDFNREMCIFCQKVSSEALSKVTAVDTGTRFYCMALELELEPLLTYLTFADQGKKGVEEDMKYHHGCRRRDCSTNTKVRVHNRDTLSADNSTDAAGAFCNLIQYITRQLEEGVFKFTYPVLEKQHQTFRDALGIPTSMNSTMLKEKLTEYYESEASWVKCDGKTFSLFFHAALQNDAIISPVEQFKMIAP